MIANNIAFGIAATLLLLAAAALHPVAVDAQHSPNVANHTNVCFLRPGTGQERNVANCQQWTRCQNGAPSLGQCQQNQLYSHVTQRCEQNNATIRAQCFACPNNTTLVDLPADFQCNQYVRCFLGRPEQRACPEGLLFDPVARQCNFAERVRCACPATDRPDQPWFVRERADCGRFNVCVRGAHVPLRCPQGLHFNRTTEQCDQPAEPQCILLDQTNNQTTTSRPPTTGAPGGNTTLSPPNNTTTRPPFRCPSNNAITFEPHPDNCEEFFICSYGVVTPGRCPNDSLFDAVTRTCVEASFARCDARGL